MPGVEEKPAWSTVPSVVRERAGAVLGARVVRAMRVWGGYGPTPSFRLRLADDRRAFFKGINAASNEFSTQALEVEVRVYREIGAAIGPWAPRCFGAFRHGDWHVLLLEDLGPSTAPPWTDTKARGVARALGRFHASTRGTALPDWIDRPATFLPRESWAQVMAESGGLRAVAALAGPEATGAHRWLHDVSPMLDRLIEEAGSLESAHALLHGDPRSDNLRWRGGALRLFDWPSVMVGPPAWDIVPLAQTITVEGGAPPDRIVEWYEAPMPMEKAAVDSAIAWWIAFFALRAWQPEIPGLPRLRRFQRQQLGTMLAWAARRFGWSEPLWIPRLMV